MAGHTISGQALPRLGEQTAKLGLPAGTTDTRSAGGNQSTSINNARFEQWQETQLHGGGVTAGAGDQLGPANSVAIDLG